MDLMDILNRSSLQFVGQDEKVKIGRHAVITRMYSEIKSQQDPNISGVWVDVDTKHSKSSCAQSFWIMKN